LELGNTILDPSKVFGAVAALSVLGLVVWWLKRKRQKRVWLPTMRVMTLEARLMPKLLLRPPPLLAFLCFLLLAAVVTGFALKPRTQVFTPFEPNQTRIHIFADMSPSVAAHVSLEDYAAKMAALYTSLKDSGRVTISTSAAPQVVEPQTAAEVAAVLTKTGFHRGGLKLGTAMKQVLEDVGEVDRVFIASDRDAHTWGGFNWQYLQEDMHVVFYDLAEGEEAAENLFINDARFLSLPNATSMEWDVEVARKASGRELDGKLNAVYQGKVLSSVPFHLGPDKQRLAVRVQWPITAIDVKAARAHSDPATAEPLIFKIEADDALKADNEFRTRLLGLKQDVLMIADAAGERLLADPAGQLGVALEVLGFRLKRFDFVNQPGPKPLDYPFWVLVGGGGEGVDRFCPKSLGEARRKAQKDGFSSGPKIWLAPASLDADYRELCQCYARLLLDGKDNEPTSKEFCGPVENRNHWVGLLPSLGAKQIGGNLGEGANALAWSGRDQNSGLSVLAFTVPLAPSLQTGINHAQMPLLVRELLTWQGIMEPRGGIGAGVLSWPRVEDVAQALWKPKEAALTAREKTRIEESNVPFGESLLSEQDQAALPPRWTAQMDLREKQLPAKKDREDPLPWLRLAAMIVVGATALEALAALAWRVWQMMSKKPEAAVLLLLLLTGLAAPRAEAKTGFAMVGYDDQAPTLQMLAREVSHRTSIELEPKPSTFSTLQPEALLEPWVWVKDVSVIAGADGHLKNDVALWLKRGGFLVVEAPLSTAQLGKLTGNLAHTAEEDAGWLPLPPDHEMMRSFYLLDALPACGADIWRGFHYDGRLAILLVPYGFLSSLKDRAVAPSCATPPDHERSVRIFVNLIMVALATDYKKDQIHLPEILKRLR
jgi:hypothetical protein